MQFLDWTDEENEGLSQIRNFLQFLQWNTILHCITYLH